MNIKIISRFFLCLLLFCLPFTSCFCPYGFTVNTLPGHIKTIAIPTFENQTDRYGIEEELTQIVADEFEGNGLKVQTTFDEVDAILEGKLLSYTKEPSSYDNAGLIREYKVTVVASWEFRDLKYDKVLSQNSRTKGWDVYPVDDSEGDTIEKEDEARTNAVEKLADDIIVKVLQNW